MLSDIANERRNIVVPQVKGGKKSNKTQEEVASGVQLQLGFASARAATASGAASSSKAEHHFSEATNDREVGTSEKDEGKEKVPGRLSRSKKAGISGTASSRNDAQPQRKLDGWLLQRADKPKHSNTKSESRELADVPVPSHEPSSSSAPYSATLTSLSEIVDLVSPDGSPSRPAVTPQGAPSNIIDLVSPDSDPARSVETQQCAPFNDSETDLASPGCPQATSSYVHHLHHTPCSDEDKPSCIIDLHS